MISSLKNRKKYKNDYLKQVIVRVDFDSELPILSDGPSSEVYDCVRKRFPLKEEKTIVGRELLISPDTTTSRNLEIKEWRYYGSDRLKNLVISPNYLIVEFNKYEHYEVLREDFLSVLDVLYKSYPSIMLKRLGLRYIDVIEWSSAQSKNWKKYLRPELSSIFSIATNEKDVSRAFHVLEFNYGKDFLRFQFGVFNPDYPAAIKNNEYTLDFDMYTNRLIEQSEVPNILDGFHDKLNQSFEEVITNELRKIMKPLEI